MTVDPQFAQWLQADADYLVRSDAGIIARWGASAVTGEMVTAIATKAAAAVEGDRQLAFFTRSPFAIEVHQIVGIDWVNALGTVVTIVHDDLGYQGGLDVFVLEVEADRATGISIVAVLRPLKGVS